MKREELEHIIRASGTITNQYEFVIIGSQSILIPLKSPEQADEIDAAIGEGSRFHRTHGYYAQGVGPNTAVLPGGWLDRVHRVQNGNTNNRIGYCLDVVDLFLSKAAAGREKDREFCTAMLEHRFVSPNQVLALVSAMPITNEEQRTLRARIRRWAKSLRDAGHDIPSA